MFNLHQKRLLKDKKEYYHEVSLYFLVRINSSVVAH